MYIYIYIYMYIYIYIYIHAYDYITARLYCCMFICIILLEYCDITWYCFASYHYHI